MSLSDFQICSPPSPLLPFLPAFSLPLVPLLSSHLSGQTPESHSCSSGFLTQHSVLSVAAWLGLRNVWSLPSLHLFDPAILSTEQLPLPPSWPPSLLPAHSPNSSQIVLLKRVSHCLLAASCCVEILSTYTDMPGLCPLCLCSLLTILAMLSASLPQTCHKLLLFCTGA